MSSSYTLDKCMAGWIDVGMNVSYHMVDGLHVFYRDYPSNARSVADILDASSRMKRIPVSSFSREGKYFSRRHLTTGDRACACGGGVHLDERQPEVLVDTHVFRVSRRLGLIGPKVTVEQAHTLFAKITPPEWVYSLHVNLIRHGRQVCHAQHPKCAQCSLYSECAYVGSVNPQETAISD